MGQQEWFAQKKALGLAAEKMVEKYLTNRGASCHKPIHKDPDEPYDCKVTDRNGNVINIEVKNYGRPDLLTIFAETLQIGTEVTLPEYLLYTDKIDFMIYVDQGGKEAYVYEMKKFASYVRQDMHNDRLIDGGTARGIKVYKREVKAGYIKTIDL